MAKITWLGEDEGDIPGPSFTTWQDMRFDKGKPVEVTDLEMIANAKGNRFFRVDDDDVAPPAHRGPGRPPKNRHDEDPE